MKTINNIDQRLGDDLKEQIKPGAKLRIAAPCFSIYAFEALKKELEQIEWLEFIFTSPTFLPDKVTDKIKKEYREFQIPKSERERSFYGSEFEIRLKNQLTQRAIAKECAEWIRRKAKFSSNCSGKPMQKFGCISNGSEHRLYQQIEGFTAVDLGYQKGDAVSNIITRVDDPETTRTFLDLFDNIWNNHQQVEDVTSYLCEHISSVYSENSPAHIYYLILYNIFSEFLEDISEDVLPNDRTGYKDSVIWNKLYNFQKDAVSGIINKLETYNGCILADSVGLGKTFSALAVIKYYELRNRNVMVLCPKKLADNWLNYRGNLKTNSLVKDRLNYDVFCHTDLLRASGDSFGMPLNRVNWSNYDLLVIDESHNFRNNDAYKETETRYSKLMNEVIRKGVKTKVLMLSATPVNNRFNDLRNQLALAYEGQSSLLSDKLGLGTTIEEVFRRAQAAFNEWSKRPSEQRTAASILNTLDFDFFKVLDSVTIARSRKHIQTFYDTSEIGTFPERLKPISIQCPLTTRPDVIDLNEIFKKLTTLKLAFYAPVNYILASRVEKYQLRYDQEVKGGKSTFRQADREKSLQALMTINLLKRLESSVEAFRITLSHLATNYEATLKKIDKYNKTGKDSDFIDHSGSDDFEIDDDDISESSDFEIGGTVKVNLADMDLVSWQRDLTTDLSIINKLLVEMKKITPEYDAKLQSLKQQIRNKIANPLNPGNRKILLFTAFADTADYLYEHLSSVLLEKYGIHSGKVTGAAEPKTTIGKSLDFQSVLTLFSPISKEKSVILPEETAEIDLLIGTDCISEGQNLQDCDMVINYDIHWNPVRIIQRFGRIDRIGSRNKVIQLVNYWPDITLDEYINLRERVENRMIITDITATGDDNVLSAKPNDISYRKEQLRRLQEEVVDLEDLKTGVSITDLGLNEFRMDLLNDIRDNGDLANIPTGMHAVVPADEKKGLYRGVIFTLRNRNQGVNINHQNRLHPYYLVYMKQDGTLLIDHMQPKKILDLLRTSCKPHSQALPEVYKGFNAETNDGRNMKAYSELLDKAIHSIISIKEKNDIDSLFEGEHTTALVDGISGLDDFELIAFLVVRNAS
jgi:Superfamily II DNA/RNA helicases, SNF2 family